MVPRPCRAALHALMAYLVMQSSGMLVWAEDPDFASEIRPLLSDRCFACHGPDQQHREADLRLDRFDALEADRGGYQIVNRDRPNESELLRRILSTDEDEVMPPPEFGKPLLPEERERLSDWVSQGAQWEEHWAYRPPKGHPSEAMSALEASRCSNWVDAFVLARLREKGGRFNPAAVPHILVRRLAIDLTGLPPTSDEVAFVATAKDRPAAYAQLVDRYLSSPAFGERMAQFWLDLVRYADTVGYHGDQDHNISPYRDYVIRSFNEDRPFDDFTTEQLAGDLLPASEEVPLEATGYNRLLQTTHEGGLQPSEYLAIYAADRVRNVSAVWMGATVGCAQCHDHKYDPISTREFYELSAFFADVDEAQHFKVGTNSLPTKRPPERRFPDALQRSQLRRIDRLRSEWQSSGGSVAELEQKRQEILEQGRMCMITQPVPSRTVRVLPRGNWMDDSGETVVAGVPSALGKLPSEIDRPNRLDLARWLIGTAPDAAGPLTSRVMVNRIWALLMGSGLSESVEDFGAQGKSPSLPKLLDRLAIEFVDADWDVKHVMRTIVLSNTYRQSSGVSDWHRQNDPDNRYFARQNSFRVPAENVRDIVLSTAKILVRQTGGASVKPYQPAGHYQHLNFPTRKYRASAGVDQYRRGVYTHWQRQFLHPMLAAFDAATREECTAARAKSNTPLAALALLNDPSMMEAAVKFAENALRSGTSEAERVAEMFASATSRAPTKAEIQVLAELLQTAKQEYENPGSAVLTTQLGDLADPSGVRAAELAAWTMVGRAILNLAEVHTRN